MVCLCFLIPLAMDHSSSDEKDIPEEARSSVYSSAIQSLNSSLPQSLVEIPDHEHFPATGNCLGGCFGHSRLSTTDSELERLSKSTGLGSKEVHALYDRFRKVAPRGFMTKTQFKQSLGLLGMLPNDYIPNRMFAAFDSKKDGVITFDEYCTSFAVLLRGSEIEKLKLSFRLADSSDSGHLSFHDFSNLLIACDSTTTALIEKATTDPSANLLS